jgi:hypothetical protein
VGILTVRDGPEEATSPLSFSVDVTIALDALTFDDEEADASSSSGMVYAYDDYGAGVNTS